MVQRNAAGSLAMVMYHEQASLRPCRPLGRAEGRSPSAFFYIPQSARGGRLRRNGGHRGLIHNHTEEVQIWDRD